MWICASTIQWHGSMHATLSHDCKNVVAYWARKAHTKRPERRSTKMESKYNKSLNLHSSINSYKMRSSPRSLPRLGLLRQPRHCRARPVSDKPGLGRKWIWNQPPHSSFQKLDPRFLDLLLNYTGVSFTCYTRRVLVFWIFPT